VQVQALGHVVLKVRDLQLAEVFYSGTLGMRVVLRIEDPRMTFFTLETPGNHHDFALMEIETLAERSSFLQSYLALPLLVGTR
jgi:catechol 2,3-dioxygenase